MQANLSETAWFQRYRPQTLADVVLDDDTRKEFQDMVDKKEVTHLLLAGRPGIGKTTLMKILIKALDADHLYINASKERGIDLIRNKIMNFSTTMSFEDKPKIIQFDEGDKLTQDAQDALKSVMEEFSNNVTFIITCNHVDKIEDAIRSRCTEYNLDPKDKKKAMRDVALMCVKILKNENVEFEPEAIKQIVTIKYPDIRSVVNSLQRASRQGKIDMAAVESVRATSLDGLIVHLKAKKFREMCTFILENVQDHDHFISDLWNRADEIFKPESLPYAVMHLDDAQDRLTRVADRHLTLVACMTKIMSDCTVKD